MSSDREKDEEGWSHSGEDLHEFAYEEYATPLTKKKSTQEETTKVDDATMGVPLKDAFLGKHCPICLGEISVSSSVIDSCHHIYCTACLFEVGGVFLFFEIVLTCNTSCSRTRHGLTYVGSRAVWAKAASTQPYPTLSNPSPAVQPYALDPTNPTRPNSTQPTPLPAAEFVLVLSFLLFLFSFPNSIWLGRHPLRKT